MHVPCDAPTVVKYQYRDIRRIDLADFQNDILQSPLYDFDCTTSVDDYVELFNDEVQRIVDKHAPLKSRTRRIGRNDCRWLSAEAREAKRRCRRTDARTAITRSRTVAIKQRFDEASSDVAATWHVVRDVLHRDQRPVHSDSQCQTLAAGFSQFFVNKLARIRQPIAASLLQSGGSVFTARQHTGPTLSLLAPRLHRKYSSC